MFTLVLSTLVALHTVPGASPFPNGLHCAASPFAMGDILPDPTHPHAPGSYVVHIAKVESKGMIVGYLYTMKNGERLLQPTGTMPESTLRALHAIPLQLKDAPQLLPESLKPVECSKQEFSTRPQ